MKIGKILLMVMLIVGFMTLVGCGKKAEEKAPAMVEKTEEAVTPAKEQEETQPTKAWTDDDFVEYWAQLVYLQEKYAANPMKHGEELGKLYKKLGMEGAEDEFSESYGQWLGDWQQKAMADPEKAGKEWQKLMERMQKRVEELRKGK